VARDVNGDLLMNQNVSFLISILQGSASGPAVYSETHSVLTNGLGLVNLEIGNGTVVTGNFSAIVWGSNSHYIKVEMDPAGGTLYQPMGTSQLLSVPYALYSESSGSTAAAGHKIADADGNTYIDVEENPNEDTIRFYVGGSEKMRFDGFTLELFTGGSLFIGDNAGANSSNYPGNSNTGIGENSLFSNSTGSLNTAVGQHAMKNNQTGSQNVAVGYGALSYNISGGGNTAVGVNAANQNKSIANSAFGSSALHSNISGVGNTALGWAALSGNNSGANNVAVGRESGAQNLQGSFNVFLGFQAGYDELGDNRLYIENSNADKNNALIYGEFDNDLVRINNRLGIGTAPSTGSSLDVFGGTRFTVRLDSDGRSKVGNLYSSDDTLAVVSFGNVEVSIDDNNNSTGKAFRVIHNTNQELFRVQDNNRVGIGTSTPGYRLHVMNGDAMVEDSSWCYFKIKSQNEGTDPYLQLYAGDDSWSLQHDDSDANKFLLRYNSSTKMALASDGSMGVGTPNPNASAILDASSTSKGFLPPRMSSTQIANIQTPANGLMVFSTTDRHVYVFNTTDYAWKRLAYDATTITPVHICGNPLYDPRDGQFYETVQIGTQCWMAENLNIGTMINGSSNPANNGITEKYCFDNSTANCDVYGGLYQWNEMMQYVTTPGVKGICPDGWHLPTDAEWTTLSTYLGGESVAGGKMKEAGLAHWAPPNIGATNESGFTALPGGTSQPGGTMINLTYFAYIWSSSQSGSNAWMRYLNYSNATVLRNYYDKYYSHSVRCVKN